MNLSGKEKTGIWFGEFLAVFFLPFVQVAKPYGYEESKLSQAESFVQRTSYALHPFPLSTPMPQSLSQSSFSLGLSKEMAFLNALQNSPLTNV